MDYKNEKTDLMRRCSKCDNEKQLYEFNFRKDTQKYRNQCRGCIRLMSKRYRTTNKEEIKLRRKIYCEIIKSRKLEENI